jgi:hypothetical protein
MQKYAINLSIIKRHNPLKQTKTLVLFRNVKIHLSRGQEGLVAPTTPPLQTTSSAAAEVSRRRHWDSSPERV